MLRFSFAYWISDRFIVIIIVARVAYRWSWLHRFRGDDRWMAAAGVWALNPALYTVLLTL